MRKQFTNNNPSITDLSKRQFIKLGLTTSSWLLLNSCVTRDTSRRYREGNNQGQDTSLSVADEIRMTAEVMPQMQKDYPRLNDDVLQNYLQALGRKIAIANRLENNPYKYNFTLIKTNQVNAFALPAGEVMVTAPLILMAESEAELAGVIGHEIGHIQARHTAERMDSAKKAQSDTWKYAAGGGLLGGLLGYGLGRIICKPQDKTCLADATSKGLGAGLAGGVLVQKYGFMQNSQEDELEADRIGFRTSVAAGFHPQYVGKFYEKLYQMEQQRSGSSGASDSGLGRSLQDALSTHPPSKQRVQQMQSLATQVIISPQSLINSNDFMMIKNRLKKISS